jgi:Arc/MetJ-type ribon-helix-helix transcriptional regulator
VKGIENLLRSEVRFRWAASSDSQPSTLTPAARNERTSPWYTKRMTTVQVPTRFDNSQLVRLDQLVAEGLADSRSEVIRLAVDALHDAHRRRVLGQTIADAYRLKPQTDSEDAWAMANAIALTEAESW